jgi:hypothetical protein
MHGFFLFLLGSCCFRFCFAFCCCPMLCCLRAFKEMLKPHYLSSFHRLCLSLLSIFVLHFLSSFSSFHFVFVCFAQFLYCCFRWVLALIFVCPRCIITFDSNIFANIQITSLYILLLSSSSYQNYFFLHSMVFMAADKLSGEVVALKRIKIEQEENGFPITAIREIKILRALSHDNIVTMKEIVTSRGK